MWISADAPPDGEPGQWSRAVVVITNAGNAFRGSYFHGDAGGGTWQLPTGAQSGEVPAMWTELPILP